MDIVEEVLSSNDLHVTFDVNNPQKSFAGYTVYRLVLKVMKHPSCDIIREEFLSWKRFSEFKKLHHNLKGSFPAVFKEHLPEFAKGKIFGRFDDSVIEERRVLSNKLLSIICDHKSMMRDMSFSSFIEHGRVIKSHNAPLEIDESDDALDHCSDQGQPQNTNGSTEKVLHVEFDNVLDNENDANSSNEQIDGATNSMSDGNEQQLDNDVFSPSNDDVTSNGVEDSNQSFFREARSICGDDIEELASEAADEFPYTSPRNSSSEQFPYTSPRNSSSEHHSSDSTTNQSHRELTRSDSDSNNNQNASLDDSCSIEHTSLHHNFTVDEKMSEKIEKVIEEDDYIFQASLAMSEANEQEELGNSEAAFELYKFGVGLLLRGVQTDGDKQRRDAVRRKTAQYLLRAEKLYKGRLISSDNDKFVLGDNKWRFKLSDVKVFGVIDNVMLVQKVYCDDVYVMKVLHKKGGEYKPRRTSKKKQKSPRNLYNWRSVARLYNCVETSTGIYLLLEYVSGGRLWDHLGMSVLDCYLLRRRQTLNNESIHSWNPADRSSSTHAENSDATLAWRVVDHNNVETQSKQCSKTHDNNVIKWAAQIAYSLMEIHTKGIVCRDLNPRNILIDSVGNIKLSYFSNVDGVDYALNDAAVEMLYTSPEINGVNEPTAASDWWSFGALLFELLMKEPLYVSHPNGITPRSVITLPKRVSSQACSLLSGLLKYNPTERLGSGPSGNEEIKSHPFFSPINWAKVWNN